MATSSSFFISSILFDFFVPFSDSAGACDRLIGPR